MSDESLGIPQDGDIVERKYKFRKSARAVLFNDKEEISLQLVGRLNYYKLPGGGVDPGETVEEALIREIKEEVGCKIRIEKEIGITIEYRVKHDLLHISYGYIGHVDGEIGEPEYEQGEIDDGFKPLWVPLDKAIEMVDPTAPLEDYQSKFIVLRENTLLKEAKTLLG